MIESLQSATRTFLRQPLLALFWQLPTGILAIFDPQIERFLEKNLWLALALLLPSFCLLSLLSTSLTYAWVREGQLPGVQGLRTAAQRLWANWPAVVKLTLVLSLILGVSLPLVLPALYFGALYQFAPHYLIEGRQSSVFAYLALAKRLVQPRLFFWVGIVSLVFVLEAGLPWLLRQSALPIKASLPMVAAAMINLWFAFVFLKLSTPRGSHD